MLYYEIVVTPVFPRTYHISAFTTFQSGLVLWYFPGIENARKDGILLGRSTIRIIRSRYGT